MYEKFGILVDGEWRRAGDGGTMAVASPVTEQTIGEVACASVADTEAALASAARGFEAWRKVSAFERADTLHRIADAIIARKDEIKTMVSTETGKPLAQSEREWGLAVDQFRWYAEEARRIYGRIVESRAPNGRYEISHEPVGIVGAFTAWNFPLALVARKVAPALAAGCSVIVRPSNQTPGTAMLLMDCVLSAGLPAGAVNLVAGPTGATYGPIMADKAVRKVSLTGSTRVGQQMLRDAADTVKKCSMELGGNAPLIVYDDADLDATLDIAVPTKFANAGQVCVSPDRFFVHDSLYDGFVEGFVERAKKLRLGDGLDAETQMGPLIKGDRLGEIEGIIAEAVGQGAKVATGGGRARDFNAGHFHEPTVLTDVTDDMRVFAEENFGPVAAIGRFSSEEEVLSRANSSDMGLASYAFTTSPARARRTIAALKSGMVGVNSFALAASEAPFGGTNFSGMGREGGAEGISDYLDTKLAQVAF